MDIKTKEEFERALKDEDWRVRAEAVWSKYFEVKHAKTALKDEHWAVRRATVLSKYFGPEHMDTSLNDDDWYVRRAAKLSTSHMIIKNLDDLLICAKVYD